MSNPIKPWSNHHQVVWAIGVLGLLFLVFGLFMAWLLKGGFGPGNQTSPPGITDLFGTVLLGIPFVYYIVVAHRPWTRKLWITGVVIHCVTLIFFILALMRYRGGNLAAPPFLLVGLVTWILYAKRNALSENSGCEDPWSECEQVSARRSGFRESRVANSESPRQMRTKRTDRKA
jgi:hypothetical protein